MCCKVRQVYTGQSHTCEVSGRTTYEFKAKITHEYCMDPDCKEFPKLFTVKGTLLPTIGKHLVKVQDPCAEEENEENIYLEDDNGEPSWVAENEKKREERRKRYKCPKKQKHKRDRREEYARGQKPNINLNHKLKKKCFRKSGKNICPCCCYMSAPHFGKMVQNRKRRCHMKQFSNVLQQKKSMMNVVPAFQKGPRKMFSGTRGVEDYRRTHVKAWTI